MDLMICLPPKSGTSNWQKALDVHFLNLTKGAEAASEFAREIQNGETILDATTNTLYNVLPRVGSTILQNYTKEKKDLREILTASKRVANTRNPFSRVHSAWHDKMRNDRTWSSSYDKYLVSIRQFHQFFGKIPDGLRTTFEAFVEFIASNPGNLRHNPHWKSIFSHCSPCAIDYNFITHLENSEEEIDPLLKEIGLFRKINISGKYSWDENANGKVIKEDVPVVQEEDEAIKPADEMFWKNVPRETAIEIYRHYFLDFVIFGYSTEDVLK